MHHKKSSSAEVAGLDMKICVTMGEVNQVAVSLVALQEAKDIFLLVMDLSVVVALKTQTNIERVEMERKIKVAPMAISVMSIALFSR